MTNLDRHPLFRGVAVIAAALVLFAIGFALHEEPEPPAPPVTSRPLPSATATPEAAPPSEATPSPTVEPTETPGPGPEPAFGELPPALVVAEAGTWIRQPLTTDGEATPDHGVVIRDLASGGEEHWSLAVGPRRGAEFIAYDVAGDGRLATFGTPFEPIQIVDRVTAAAFTWDAEQLRFAAASADGRLILGSARAREDGLCLFWVVDVASGVPAPLLRFGVNGNSRCDGVSAAFDPIASERIVMSANRTGGGSTVYAIDLEAGTVDGITDGGGYLEIGVDERGPHWANQFGDVREPPLGLSVVRVEWGATTALASDFVATAEGARLGPLLISPDGQLIAWQEHLRLGTFAGLGGWFEWPVVVIADADTGAVLFRVVRSTLTSGVSETSWLSDSSGLILAVESQFALLELGRSDPDGDVDEGRGVIDPTLRLLPFDHLDHASLLPDPAPHDPALLARDFGFIDLDGTEQHPPMPRDWARSGPLRSGWTSGGREYYLATWAPGAGDFGDGPLAPLGLAPRLEFPPFTNEVRLVTAEATQLYEAATDTSPETWTLEAGIALTVQNDASQDCLFDLGCATLIDPDFDLDPRPWWIFVRAEDGRAGWADAATLAWAE